MAYVATNQLRLLRTQIIDPDMLNYQAYAPVLQQLWVGDVLLGELDEWRDVPAVDMEIVEKIGK